MNPAITTAVCLCTHNGAQYLGLQLDSLEAQDRRPDLLVVGDDASSDATLALLEQFAIRASFPVTVIRRDVALGYRANLEGVLRSAGASADVLFICDQDDIWEPDKIAAVAAVLEADPSCDGVFSDSLLIDGEGVSSGRTLWQHVGLTRAQRDAFERGDAGVDVLTQGNNVVAGHALAVRASVTATILPFPDIPHVDWWIALLLAERGALRPLDRALVRYRLHGANTVGLPDARPNRERLQTSPSRLFLEKVKLLSFFLERSPDLDAARRARIESQIAHLTRRATMPASRPARLPAVLHELAGGGYARHSNGYRSAVRDLVVPPPRP